jgi:hypothetical protein
MENFTREGFAAQIVMQAMPVMMQNGANSESVAALIKTSVAIANALCDELYRNQPELWPEEVTQASQS